MGMTASSVILPCRQKENKDQSETSVTAHLTKTTRMMKC